MLVESLVEGLNPEQRLAVETTEGPLLVLAGAGSGKTRVLTHRIAYLVGGCGIPPESILAVTFTNKAAGEMKERIGKILGPEATGLWVATFHSTCVRILRREIGHLGLSRGFVIYDEGDALGVVKDVVKRRGLDPRVWEPKRLRWKIDEWKNAGVTAARARESARDGEEETLADVYAAYQRALADADALDFGDLLLHTVDLFERFPEVLSWYRRRWQYVLVDEYQDTNRVQYRLVNQLAGEHRNLCVVGDPDQSIYAWRGADVRNILDFERDYEDARVVKLERNYRSTQPILDGASGVIAHNLARREKRMTTDRAKGERIELQPVADDREEAQYVVGRMLAAHRREGRPWRDFAVLYRTNAQSRPFEEELLKYDVPYAVVGGVRFYERMEVKDALAYLRVLVNPKDDAALRRIVNKPARGIGKTTVERAAEWAAAREVPLLEGLRAFAQEVGGRAASPLVGGRAASRLVGGRAASRVAKFLHLLDELRAECLERPVPVAEAIARALDRSGYLRALQEERTPEAEDRVENLKELLAGAEDFHVANEDDLAGDRSELELFLDQVALVSDVDAWEAGADRVSLLTVHSAKGLEFPCVFLAGMEEGIFPHASAEWDPTRLEEERRLCYVGMTRAMDRLVLTCAGERRRYGSRSFQQPSRFLREIPPSVLADDPFGAGVGVRTGRSARAARSEGGRALDYSYAQDEAGDGAGVAPGLRVRHPVFGAGTVVAVIGDGASQKLKIRFDRVGVKTVMVRYANLELG